LRVLAPGAAYLPVARLTEEKLIHVDVPRK